MPRPTPAHARWPPVPASCLCRSASGSAGGSVRRSPLGPRRCLRPRSGAAAARARGGRQGRPPPPRRHSAPGRGEGRGEAAAAAASAEAWAGPPPPPLGRCARSARHGQDPGGAGELVAPAAAEAGDRAAGGGVGGDAAEPGAVPRHVRPQHPAGAAGPRPLPAAGGAAGAGGLRPLPPRRVRGLLQPRAGPRPAAARLRRAEQPRPRHPRLHPGGAAPHHELPLGAGALRAAAGGGAAAGVRAAGPAALRPPLPAPGRLPAVPAPRQKAFPRLLPAAGAEHRPLPEPGQPGGRAAPLRLAGDSGQRAAAERLEGRARHSAALPAGAFRRYLRRR